MTLKNFEDFLYAQGFSKYGPWWELPHKHIIVWFTVVGSVTVKNGGVVVKFDEFRKAEEWLRAVVRLS